MFGITGKWGWHDWLIVFLRVSWSIFTLIEITHSREIFPIPYWMMVGKSVV